jgi:ParB-like chromosome segregation protein Spo0J
MITHPSQTLAPMGVLHLAEYNPRSISTEELEKLKTSIREFGFIQPVVARKEDGLVIGGHQRLAAMRALLEADGKSPAQANQFMVPVIYLDGLTDERAKLLNLALNKISGEWDYQKLSDLFSSLEGTSSEEMLLSGFSGAEVQDILGLMPSVSADLPVPGFDPDAILEEEARRFAFKLESQEDADIVTAALRAYGMASPKDASIAFARAMKAALAVKGLTPDVPANKDVPIRGKPPAPSA